MTTNDSVTVTFADLGLSEPVLEAVADMGYERPTPVQAASIPEVLAGRDLLAAAQTGTGKTAAFLLPTMDRLPRVKRTRGNKLQQGSGPRMLVITPTRELAQQIDDVCSKVAARTGHVAVTVVGGVSYNPQKSALRRGCDILVATPGRLEDLVNQGACMLDEVQVLVLDEADRMLDMGFLPTVRRIVSQTPADRQTLLFSATLDESAVGSITDLVRDPARVEIAPATSTAETVDQYVLPVSLEAKNNLLAQLLGEFGPQHVIVFARTKRRADTVCRRLSRAGISAAAIHGDRSQAQRERALRDFRSGKCDVLVATDVLARGIDISEVSYVVNFDVPEEPVDYIHRIGRTGRAGEEGWSVTFVTEQDVEEFYDIEALMGKTADLFAAEDLEGLDLGASPVHVDPDRVPRDHVPGKKEKKRRRDRTAKKLMAKYGEDAVIGGVRVSGKRPPRPARKDGAGKGKAAEGERPVAAHTTRVADESVADAPKPSRRKRSGRVRVRANGSIGGGEQLTERERAAVERTGRAGNDGSRAGKKGVRTGSSEDSGHGGRKRGGETARGEGRGNRGQGGRGRGERGGRGRGRGANGGSQRGFDANAERGEGRKPSDDWRNYDDPMGRDRRAARSMRASRSIGRDGRRNMDAPSRQKRGGRRPGDNGGRSGR